jgi:8-oxo-dGTP pyrophosphatase MutT (NUDIX family)
MIPAAYDGAVRVSDGADDLERRVRPALAELRAPTIASIEALGARPAAVLVPVLAAAPEPRVVFTRRGEGLSRHAGEISFPGGLADPSEDLRDTALRETEEELGVRRGDVDVLGALPPVHTHVSGIVIAPFVGLLRVDPILTPNAAEIAEVIEVPLRVLAGVGEVRWLERDGVRFPTHVFDVGGHVIWGATGRILHSFLRTIDPGRGDGA